VRLIVEDFRGMQMWRVRDSAWCGEMLYANTTTAEQQVAGMAIIPHGPHHSRGTKNTLTTLAYCISQISYTKARIL
jgi:hypothetical protein